MTQLHERLATSVGEWQRLDPDRLRYEMVFTPSSVVHPDQTEAVRRWLEEEP